MSADPKTVLRGMLAASIRHEAKRVGSRYFHLAGDVCHANGRKVDLTDALDLVGAWGREAIKADQFGHMRLARLYAADALSLHQALTQALRWRRAAGVLSPISDEVAA